MNITSSIQKIEELRHACVSICRTERRITDFFKSAKAGAAPGKMGLQSVRCQLCRVLMPVDMGAVCSNCKPKVRAAKR